MSQRWRDWHDEVVEGIVCPETRHVDRNDQLLFLPSMKTVPIKCYYFVSLELSHPGVDFDNFGALC